MTHRHAFRLLLLAVLLAVATEAMAQQAYRIFDFKQKNRDSLAIKQNNVLLPRFQANPGLTDGDTITVTGVLTWSVANSVRTLTGTNRGRPLFYLSDTTATGQQARYGGLLVNEVATATEPLLFADSSTDAQGFTVGRIVTLTGRVRQPFGSPNGFHETPEFDLLPNEPFFPLGRRAPLQPLEVVLDSLINPDGTLNMINGEQYDGCFVKLVGPLKVGYVRAESATPNSGGGGAYDTWWFANPANPAQRLAAGSRSTTTTKFLVQAANGGDNDSLYAIPAQGQIIDSVLGFVGKVRLDNFADNGIPAPSGALGRTFRLVLRNPYTELFKSNQPIPPTVAATRTTVVPTPAVGAALSFTVKNLNASGAIDSVVVFYSASDAVPTASSGAPYTRLAATKANASDTLWTATIPAQPAGRYVVYYAVAYNTTTVAPIGLASQLAPADTSAATGSKFFYRSIDGNPTIRDIQLTPYVDGNPWLLGRSVTVTGVVTADSSDRIDQANSTVTIQSGTGPWSGIFVRQQKAGGVLLVKNDSVSVTGTVTEQFNVTMLGTTSVVTKLGTGVPVPATVVTSPQVRSGSATAENYEGVKLDLNNVRVVGVPGFGEFIVNEDGTPNIGYRIDDQSDAAFEGPGGGTLIAGQTIVGLGNQFTSASGIGYFGFGDYKLIPFKSNGFAGYNASAQEIRTSPNAKEYALSQNYPNPFNPSTTIRYALQTRSDVSLKVYDVLGRVVASLVNGTKEQGNYEVRFDASRLASGLYFYKLTATGATGSASFVETKKMMLVK